VDDPIVGHKTMADGSHTPLLKSEADALWADATAAKAKRANDMPTEREAINALWSAYQRLKELDWNDAIYCPKDGSAFDVIEAGSTGIFPCCYQGEWPDGHWWIEDAGDIWPSRPILYRRTEAEKAKWAELGRRFRRDSDASLAEDAKRLSPEGVAARAEGIAQPLPPSQG